VAGKAHPSDARGKEFVRDWARFVQRPDIRSHAVFVEDYDMELAEELVQGVDVWINTPRRPWEACGTSGMKVLVNGGLNLSELDGWWAEAFSPDVGWALGDGRQHQDPGWDASEARQLYSLLEDQIVPEFYARDASGVPRAWVARIRASMSTLTPQFSGNRMVRDYVEQSYLPAMKAYRDRSGGRQASGKDLHAWELQLRRGWDHIHFGGREVRRLDDGYEVSIQVYLGELDPDLVVVELYAEPGAARETNRVRMECATELTGATHGYLYRARVSGDRPEQDYTVRVLPWHVDASLPIELPLVLWQR